MTYYCNVVILNELFDFTAFKLDKFITLDDINKVLVYVILCYISQRVTMVGFRKRFDAETVGWIKLMF